MWFLQLGAGIGVLWLGWLFLLLLLLLLRAVHDEVRVGRPLQGLLYLLAVGPLRLHGVHDLGRGLEGHLRQRPRHLVLSRLPRVPLRLWLLHRRFLLLLPPRLEVLLAVLLVLVLAVALLALVSLLERPLGSLRLRVLKPIHIIKVHIHTSIFFIILLIRFLIQFFRPRGLRLKLALG